jgi:alanine-synthesizing transaminase
MRSSRLPADLTPNAVTRALARALAAGRDVVDLTESNPTRVDLDYPPDTLAPLADPAALAYEPQPLGLRAAREAVAAGFAARGLAVPVDRVALTASTSEAYALLFKLLCDPGDEVLVPRPSYPLFEHLTALESIRAVPYDLEYHGRWDVDLASVRRAAGPRAKIVLVVSPNNPTGSWLHAEDLAALAGLCAGRGLALVGDEVFADYPLAPDPTAVSVLAQHEAVTIALGGLSKSAGLPQVKLAWLAVQGPDAEVDDLLRGYEIVADTYLSVSTPVQVAAPRLLAAGAAIRDQILARVQYNLAVLRDLLRAAPSVSLLAPEGGWSAVLQVPAVDSEERIVLRLLEEDDVLVHPGYFFDFPREAFLVVSLIVEPSRFRSAMARLLARVGGRS